MFEYSLQIQLHHTDASGRTFYGAHFEMIHDAYEAWMRSLGFALAGLIRENRFFIPIVHAEYDYLSPLVCGDSVQIRLQLAEIKTSSFCLHYQILKDDGTIAGKAQTVHVAVDSRLKTKIPLPDDLRAAMGSQLKA